MYVLERNNSAWLFRTAAKIHNNQNVQLRLQGAMRDYDTFEQSLESYTRISVGILTVYKCSDEVARCENCPKYNTGCEILKTVQATIQAQKEWVEWVESNGGTVF